MFKWIKDAQKTLKIRRDIEKMRLKSDLLKAKSALYVNNSKQKAVKLTGALKMLEDAQALKDHVAATNEPHMILQILDNPMIQQLIKAGAIKLMSNGQIRTDDDELITIYKKLPADIKDQVKTFALEYIGKTQ
jgi:hypothetical protein